MSPLISVVIPVYNGERYLAHAIESIVAQSCQSIEVIVVDDGSTDHTKEVLARFGDKVQYLFQQRAGQAAARNVGIKFSKGNFLAFLDADDLWVEGKLDLQLAAFQANPHLDAVLSYVQQFICPQIDQTIGSRIHCPSEKMAGYLPGTMLIKRKAFLLSGGFDPSYRTGEFIDWYVNAKEQGLKDLMLPEVLLRRRLHGNNLGIRERDTREDYLLIAKALLDRKRKKGQDLS